MQSLNYTKWDSDTSSAENDAIHFPLSKRVNTNSCIQWVYIQTKKTIYEFEAVSGRNGWKESRVHTMGENKKVIFFKSFDFFITCDRDRGGRKTVVAVQKLLKFVKI